MPADFADEAQSINEIHLKQSLEKFGQLLKNPIPFSGRCLACGDAVEQRRYCDSTCRENHERKLLRRSP